MKKSVLIALIIVLTLLLMILMIVAGNISQDPAGTSEPTSKPIGTDPAETDPTPTPTQTQPLPTQTQPQPTEPVPDSLYTRQELEAMSTDRIGYGSGRTSGGIRAPYAENAQKQYGDYGAHFIEPDNGAIYLTFDCGYEYTAVDADGNSYRVTEKILDVLKEKDVKAVFFITLPYAQKNGDIVQRMIDEGHTVGNHSTSHPVMPDISIDRMIEEVMSLHNYVLEHFGYEMTLFRPPTGAYSVQSLCAVQNLGYENVFWSFAHLDYEPEAQPTLQDAYHLITNSHHSGAIYLLHAISTANAAVLGDAIDFFLAEGYKLERLG